MLTLAQALTKLDDLKTIGKVTTAKLMELAVSQSTMSLKRQGFSNLHPVIALIIVIKLFNSGSSA